jgi:hypothetical protein
MSEAATTETTSQTTAAEPTAKATAQDTTGKTDAKTTAVTETQTQGAAVDTTAEEKTTSKWSSTWREDMAGALPENASEDEKTEHNKLMTRLKRFNTPADAARALREQDKLISSGQLKRALPKDAKPEQIAEWRKENGIPESADKYDLGVPEDAGLTDLDQQMLKDWATAAHAAHASPELVKAGAKTYLDMRTKVAQQMEAANLDARKKVEDELRSEWGQEYRTNVDGVNSLLSNANSQAVRDLLMARTPDGVQLFNNAEVMRFLASHARELGYVGATVVPAGGDVGKGIDDEIKTIEDSMFNKDGTRNPAYWNSEKQQKRYSDLLEAQKRRNKG